MPNISVITAVHADTVEKIDWLKETIQSVLNQTFPDWEMIVVNDASEMYVEGLKSEFMDHRIRWFNSANHSGPAMCRNTGVALAESEAIIALDADDQLGSPDGLQVMYDVWQQDKTKIIYGDLQRLELVEGEFKRGRTFKLGEYSFEKSLDPRGLFPITALHSKECHERAGGWKPELELGLEDVEKWIAAGKAGFCGQRVPYTTLLYRKHDTSRAYNLRFNLRREGEMGNKIKEMHLDVYEGRYPVGCCGGSRASVPVNNPQPRSAAPATLDQFGVDDKVWVQYLGKRQGAFGVVGAFTNYSYLIKGSGHKFEVHKQDTSKFSRSGRGDDFAVGVQAPEEAPVKKIEITEEGYVAPPPQLAVIERVDRRGMDNPSIEVDPQLDVPIVQEIVQPAEETYADPPIPSTVVKENGDLSGLQLGNFQSVLEKDGWTVEKLAKAKIGSLMKYPQVGSVRASKIIERAKEVLA